MNFVLCCSLFPIKSYSPFFITLFTYLVVFTNKTEGILFNSLNVTGNKITFNKLYCTNNHKKETKLKVSMKDSNKQTKQSWPHELQHIDSNKNGNKIIIKVMKFYEPIYSYMYLYICKIRNKPTCKSLWTLIKTRPLRATACRCVASINNNKMKITFSLHQNQHRKYLINHIKHIFFIKTWADSTIFLCFASFCKNVLKRLFTIFFG